VPAVSHYETDLAAEQYQVFEEAVYSFSEKSGTTLKSPESNSQFNETTNMKDMLQSLIHHNSSIGKSEDQTRQNIGKPTSR